MDNVLTLVHDRREGPARSRLLLPDGTPVAGVASLDGDDADLIVTIRRKHLREFDLADVPDFDCGCGGAA